MGMAAAQGIGTTSFTYPSIQQRRFVLRETAPVGEAGPGGESVSGREATLRKKRNSISTLSDNELLKAVSRLRVTEKKIELSMLLYLVEVESRSLDLSMGFSSLFEFCRKQLKYSRSVAGRRIRVARSIRRFPEVYKYLSAGKVNVCTVSQVADIMKPENYRQILDRISGMSTRKVEILVSESKPATKIRDRMIPVKVFQREDQNTPPQTDSTPSAVHRQSSDLFALSTENGSLGDGGAADGRTGASNNPVPGNDSSHGTESSPSAVHGVSAWPPLIERGPHEGSTRVVTVQKFKIQFAVSPEFKEKFEMVKSLMSTKNPRGIGFEEAFEALMDEYIEKHSPEAREKRRETRVKRQEARKMQRETRDANAKTAKGKRAELAMETTKVSKTGEKTDPETAEKTALSPSASAKGPGEHCSNPDPSRFIPQAIKDNVFKRDGGRCTYRGPDGQRCDSTWNLQVDHIKPFALGGSNSPDNLQLLCRRHNQHKALKDFGKKKVRSRSKS